MSRVARSKRKLFVYLLLTAIGFVLFAHAYDRPKAQLAEDPNPFEFGRWELSFSAPHPMSHAAVLPNGKVLYWTAVVGPPTDSRLWNCVLTNGLCELDVNSNYDVAIPYNTTDLFCSGHSLLQDGRLFAAGGSIVPRVGTTATTIFNLDPSPTATPPANGGPTMTNGRWYTSTVTLGNGETAIVSGDYCSKGPPQACEEFSFNKIPEVLNSAGTSLRSLDSAELELTWYPWLHLAAAGTVFHSGPVSPSRWLTTSGTGSWSLISKPYFYSQSPYFLTNREWGGSVMYDVDKVLIAGGGLNPPSNTAETIDLTNETGNWTNTDDMEYPRRHFNLTILADGKVLATGGTQGNGFNNSCLSNAILPAELWDPGSGKWSTMARLNRRRQYHSVAVLLIDGRVLVGGTTASEATDGCRPIQDELQQEIFTPPYLFNADGSLATRPNITNAPETISYNTQFLVNTPLSTSIAKVTMVRLSSVTHSTNMNQRINHLTFSRVGTGLRVNAPANGNVCPPGHYMLFIINHAGVPSVARIVKIQ